MIRRRTIWIAALVAIVAVGLLGTALVVMLPDIVRRAAVWRLEALTQRRVTIDRVDVNVFTGDVAVHDLRIIDRDEPVDLARVELIKGRVHRRSLLELHVWIDELLVERSSVRIVRFAGNRFNISDLLERPARPPSGLGVTVDRLRVTDGTVVLEDRTLRPARTWKSERIAIEARNLSTARGEGSGTGSTVVAGAPVHVHVEDLRLVPIHVRAHVTVGNVDLALLRLYLPGNAVVLPESGVLAAGVTVVHDAREGTVISAGARIQRLALEHRRQDVPFATSPETLVTLNDLHLKGGGFALGRVELEGDVNMTEALVGPPVAYAFKATRLVAEALTWPGSQPGRVSFTSQVPGGGAIDIRGTVLVEPLRADAQVKVSGVDLAHANRYIATAGTIAGVGDVDAHVVASWDRGLRLAVTGGLGASRVVVGDSRAPSAPPVLTAERLEATGLEYEWPARLTLASLRARRSAVLVERDASGALTLPALFARPAPLGDAAASGGGRDMTPEISVGELRIDEGAVTLIDNTLKPPARIELANVAVGLRDATWPIRGPMRTELSAGLPGGGLLTLSGIADVDEQRTRSKLTLKNIDLAQAQPFLPFRGRVSGRLDADLEVRGRLDPFRLRLRGDVVVNEAAVEDRDQPLLAVERVGLTGVDFRWPMRLVVDQLSVRRPWAKIARDERGELTLRAAFLSRPGVGVGPGPTGERAAAAAATPDVMIKRALIEDGATSVIDDSVEPAARFEIRGSRVEARNIAYPMKIPAEVTLATPMPGGGRLEGRGTFQLEPGRLDLRGTLSGVALAPAQPYLPVDARIAGVIDGDVRIAGTLEPVALNVRGNATIGELAVGDENRALLTAGLARAQGVNVEWPGRIRVDSVEVEKPSLLLERDAAGRFRLLSLLTPHGMTPAPRSGDNARRRTPLRIDIGTARVTDGFGRFVDRVPEPDFAEELSAVNVTVTGLSTAPGTVARATMRATLGPSAPVAISGEFTPPTGPRRYDVLVTVGGYPAPRANPYLQTLFGWRARQGTITLAAHYALNGDELVATNDVGAADLVVERAPGREPPKWPIGLPLDTFVSLLKNRDGDLQLTVPIHGTLSSPKFEIGDAIATALRGIAVKTVTLPFNLIGRLFVDEKERVESLQVNPVLFEAGTASLAPGMTEHVDNLAVFLRDKPAIRLLQRPVLTVEDVTRLKRAALRERVRAAAGERTPTAMQDALTALYVEKFPRRSPAAVDEMIAALAEQDPAPTAATRVLADGRVQAVRDALVGRGIDAGRLPVIDTAAAVEAEGTGRVEFEITQ